MSVFGSTKNTVHVQLARHASICWGCSSARSTLSYPRCGYVVVWESVMPLFDRLVHYLRDASLAAGTFIDIGAAYGTPWLDVAFREPQVPLPRPLRDRLR